MADVESNIRINIDTSSALGQLKVLQREISAFQQNMLQASAAQAKAARLQQQALIDSINTLKNSDGHRQFAARTVSVTSSTERFTKALETNKFAMGEYFRYAAASTKTFGKLFATEHDLINKVARERVKTLQTQYVKLGRDANGALQAIKVRPLQLDMKDLATQTAINAQKQQLFNQLIKQGSTNLLNFGKNTQWAGRQLMVGFTIPLTYLGGFAAKAFMDMEKQALRFKRVYGELFTTQAETDEMTRQVADLAKEFTKYGVEIEKTVGLAADVAAMGKMGKDLLAQLTEATRLSVLGGVEQTEALQTTISITNAFGIASEELAGKIDFLNAVENQTVTSIEDLTIAIPKAGPVIQQLGGNVEDLAFFLTAMKEGGINASEGANALKSGIASIINPTEKASKMLSGLGINIKEIVESNKGDIKSTIIEFAQALDTLNPLNRAKAIEQLFGKFQFARLSTLFQNVIAEGTQANRVLELTNATSAELAILSQRELKRIEDSPMYKFKKSIEDLKSSLIPLGEEFIKLITPIVNFAKSLLENFNKMDSGVRTVVTGIITVVGGIAPVALMTFGLIANGVANLIKFFSFLSRTFQRTAGESNILGQSTEYMTQQQLESLAVAASLDSSHSKLIQTFTAEKSSIDRLAASYRAAVSAQRAFIGNPIPTTIGKNKTKGFASGGRVPGVGNTDSIPAMLTPGEFIVKKSVAQKSMPLLENLNNGKIVGYRKGGRAGSGAEGRKDKSLITLPITHRANVSNQSGAINIQDVLPDLGNISYMYADNILKEAGVSANAVSKQIMLWERSNTTAIAAATAAVNAGVPPSEAFADLAAKFQRDMASAGGPVSEFARTARVVFPELQQDFIEAQQTVERLKLNLRIGADSARLLQELPNNKFAQSINTPGNYGRLARTRGALSTIFNRGSSKYNETGVPSFMLQKGIDTKSLAYSYRMSQEHLTTNILQEEQRAKIKVKRATQSALESVSKGVNEAAQSASPSKKAKEAGKNIADGAIEGIREGGKEAKTAGKEIITGKNGRRPRSASSPGIVTIGTSQSSELVRDPKSGNIVTKEKMAQLEDARARAAERLKRSTSIGGRASMFARKIGEKVKGINPMGATMGIGMASMGISMIPGMEGIGQAVSALSLLPMMISMLSNPIGIAVGVIGGLTAGIILLNQELEKQRKEAIQLANASTYSQKSLEKLSEDLGTVSITEAKKAEQNAKIIGISEKQISVGEQFVESTESGQKLLEDVKLQISKGISSTEIANNLSTTLGTAVRQGIVDAKMAKAIIAAISAQVGNLSLGKQAISGLNTFTGSISGMQKMFAGQLANIDTSPAPNYKTTAEALGLTGGRRFKLTSEQPLIKQAQKEVISQTEAANLYSQITGGIDVVNEYYDSLIEKAIKRAKIEKSSNKELSAAISSIESKRIKDLEKQVGLQNEILAAAKEQKKDLGETKYNANFLTAVEQSFGKESDAYRTAESLNKLSDSDFKTTMQVSLQSGALDPGTIAGILNFTANNQSLKNTLSLSIETFGLSEASNAMINLMGLGYGQNEINFILRQSIRTDDPQALANLNKVIDAANTMSANGIPVNIDAIVKNPEKIAGLAKQLNKIDKLTAKGPVKLKTVLETKGFENMKVDVDWFNNLPAESQKDFLTTFTVKNRTLTDEEVRMWKANVSGDFAKTDAGKAALERVGTITEADRASYASFIAKQSTIVGKGTGNSGDGTAGDGLSKASKKAIAAYERQIAAIEKKRDALKEVNDELERQKKFEDAQQQRINDMKQAFITGDYLKAAMLRQNMLYEKSQFDRETQIQQYDARIAELQNRISQLQSGKKVERKYYGGPIKGYNIGGLVQKPNYFFSGGFARGRDNIPAMLSEGEFVQRASAVSKYGVGFMRSINNGTYDTGTSYGDSVYNISMTINGDGANAREIADIVIKKLNTVSMKNNKGNRVI